MTLLFTFIGKASLFCYKYETKKILVISLNLSSLKLFWQNLKTQVKRGKNLKMHTAKDQITLPCDLLVKNSFHEIFVKSLVQKFREIISSYTVQCSVHRFIELFVKTILFKFSNVVVFRCCGLLDGGFIKRKVSKSFEFFIYL